MNDTLSPEDRRHVRSSRIAALAAVLTVAVGSFAWAEVNTPPAERPSAISAAPAPAPAADPAPEVSNDELGCGCAEGCRG